MTALCINGIVSYVFMLQRIKMIEAFIYLTIFFWVMFSKLHIGGDQFRPRHFFRVDILDLDTFHLDTLDLDIFRVDTLDFDIFHVDIIDFDKILGWTY